MNNCEPPKWKRRWTLLFVLLVTLLLGWLWWENFRQDQQLSDMHRRLNHLSERLVRANEEQSWEMRQEKSLRSLPLHPWVKYEGNDVVKLRFLEPEWEARHLPKGESWHLASLRELTELRELNLTGTDISDLRYLNAPKLEKLILDGSKVTALSYLRGGREPLKELSLIATKVTDAELEHLKGLTNLRVLDLQHTQVTDGGLEHLMGLTKLERLMLHGTQVTDGGVKKLQQALPNCKIQH